MPRMKRDSLDRQPDQESQDVAAPEQAEGDVAADAEAGAIKQGGEIPEVVPLPPEEQVALASPTASEQAFDQKEEPEQKPEEEMMKAADQYNEDHPHRVAEFNKLTEDACVHHGKLDAKKVRDFQKTQKLEQDGMVGPWTLAAAKDVAEIREANKSKQKEVDDRAHALENKPEQNALQEKPKTEAVAKTEVKPAVVATVAEAAPKVETDTKAAGEKAADAAKDSSNTEPAVAYNLEHASQVAEFNELTNFANTTNGQVDIEKVVAFQRAHGLTPDGRIGHDTLEAAKKTNEPINTASVAEVVQEEEQAPQMA
jgi:peptidoglycan hydrolase-like protein with peptidoglycan-binding domain